VALKGKIKPARGGAEKDVGPGGAKSTPWKKQEKKEETLKEGGENTRGRSWVAGRGRGGQGEKGPYERPAGGTSWVLHLGGTRQLGEGGMSNGKMPGASFARVPSGGFWCSGDTNGAASQGTLSYQPQTPTRGTDRTICLKPERGRQAASRRERKISGIYLERQAI